ncbi:MAG: hypothetical protein LBP59_16495 [Planctomycetaceae bacterium]|nr:hypothetical protein [Planctomycetaceae bacterium]
MFGNLRSFSIFCTIIIAILNGGVSIFTSCAIAAEHANGQNNITKFLYHNNSYPQKTPQIANSTKPVLQAIPQTTTIPQTLTPPKQITPQQNFRYIAAKTNITQDQTQTNIITKNLPPLENTQTLNQTQTPTPTPQQNLTPTPQQNSTTIPQQNLTPAQPQQQQQNLAPTQPLPETGANNPFNPFQFRESDDDNNIGLVPRNISSLPAGIQVIGIMILDNQKSIAAIRIPRTNQTQRNPQNTANSNVFYVREGDVIEAPTGNIQANRTNRGINEPASEILFLIVEKITSQHVEVRSRSNIADKHILR